MSGENDELDLDRDRPFNRREWRVQRIVWTVWGLVLLAGLIGLLGAGPLSSTTAATADGELTVAYDRFVHNQAPTDLRITVASTMTTDGALRLKISENFLSHIQIQRIRPEPVRSELVDQGVVFVFERASGVTQPVQIVFHIEHEAFGFAKANIELQDHPGIVLTQWVYP